MTVTAYGSSDDLIEIDGDIREEFTAAFDGEDNLLAFSCGVVLRIRYSDQGIWRIAVVHEEEPGLVEIVQAPEDDEDNYSDVATVHGGTMVPLTWVVHGDAIAQ